jgi:aspartyl-tRNA(Asn)/glutamyl-tRNA(Gln) amidotransferase subunit A
MPAVVTLHAQRVRRWYRDQVLRLFEEHDLFIAPATICSAPRISEATVCHGGHVLPVRASLGLYSQPFSFIGLPVVTVPVIGTAMPIGIQIIAPPWREDLALRLAARLERLGVVACHPYTEPQDDVDLVPPATVGNA